VAVKDLIRAGVVSLDKVKARFSEQAEERRRKVLAAGKKYRPTKTEEKEALQRNIIIEFRAESSQNFMVPVIFNQDPAGRSPYKGFALVTDTPPPEVRAAGHDRCPVILSKEAMTHWLEPGGLSFQQLDEILGQKLSFVFQHCLDKAS